MKKVIVGVSIIVVFGALLVVRIMGSGNKQAEEVVEDSYVSVEALEAEKGRITEYTYIVGKVEANKVANIIPTMPAEVDEINFEVGDRVTSDEVLFVLNAEDLQNQKRLAVLSVNSAKASIDQANQSVTSAQDGVKMAQIAYDMALASYESNLEQYNLAKDNLEKYEKMYAEGLVSKAQYDQVKLQASESTLVVFQKQVEQAKESLDNAKAGVASANIGTRQASAGYEQAKVSLEQATDSIDDMVYKTKIDGIVTAINIEEGIMATGTTPAFVIEDLDTVKVELNISEKIVNKVYKGEEVEVFIEALGDDAFKGVVESVSPSADARTMLYKVVVTLENRKIENTEQMMIKPGMFANVKLKINESKDAVKVDGNAIFSMGTQDYVYVVIDGQHELRPIVTGIDTGDLVEIVEGVSANEIYLINGMEFLTENTKIKVVRGDR